jgi:hypothetical protein
MLAVPMYADTFANCSATATDSMGNVQPWACPDNWQKNLDSSFMVGKGTLTINILNYLFVSVLTPTGLSIQYSGERSTSATETFLITGGSADGTLAGTYGFDYFAHIVNGAVAETYESNIPFCGCGPTGTRPISIPFTFGVPFTLSMADDFVFSETTPRLGPDAGYSSMEDVTSFNGTLSVLDSNGHVVSNAAIAEVPEPASYLLFATALVLIGWRALRILSSRRI